MLIQNNLYNRIETTAWIVIEESPEDKFYDNIRDLSVRSFWYHSNDTKKNPWVMLCSHCPINDSSGYLHTTVYLAVMLQASWHTAEGNKESKGSLSSHDGLKKLCNINFAWHRSQSFPEKEQSSRSFPFPNQIFWTKNTPLWLTRRIPSNYQKEDVVNNFKKLDNGHWKATTIHQYL